MDLLKPQGELILLETEKHSKGVTDDQSKLNAMLDDAKDIRSEITRLEKDVTEIIDYLK